MRGGNHQKWLVAGGLGALEMANHVAQDMVCFWFGAVGGQCATNSEDFWGLLGEVRGPISLHLAAFSKFHGSFGHKKADFGPKLQILNWSSGTCDVR